MNTKTSAPAALPATEPRLVYVLDDELEVCAFIERILVRIGFVVKTFARVSDLEMALTLEQPAVLIVDLSLGQSDAVEVIRSLAKSHFTGQLLLISGRHDPKTIDRVQGIGKQYGFTMLPFLQKPFRIDELKARLAKIAPGKTPPTPPPSGNELERALRNNWLELWYQPKIDLKTKLIFGAEALVRLRHPEQGVLLPSAFVPAPGDPLHRPLADFVMRRAFADWPSMATHHFKFKLAVNMPVSVFEDSEFVVNLRKYIPADVKFPGLIVELIEDEVIRDTNFAREIAIQLKLYNIDIAIDDFGSKYSTLERLSQLPFAELKIDQKYVRGCFADRSKYDVCRGIVELAHRMNMSVVAEGVETTDDIKALTAMGCDGAQGFIFARPMEKTAFVTTLLSRARADTVTV